jgi:hypothetical protein
MKSLLRSPWLTFFGGIALTVMLYALAHALVRHGGMN